MSERSIAFPVLQEMEVNVTDVERYGDLLMDLGTGDEEVARAGLYLLGRHLKDLGRSLEAQWSRAANLARGKA